ncbi:MAG: ubiquitin-like small modifier protein 1 [Haloferacaceae archaeon]|nr:ubiquitin-like small modifier protein 1 [Haloferacaceae archaeon]
MTTVTWRLFADIAEAADARRVELPVEEPTTVQAALQALCAAHPALAERVLADGTLRAEVNLLCNGAACELDAPVTAGDELALFPPVSGG